MSAGTVTATVTDHLGKRQVMGEVIEKARIGGKALGKGAASLGRAAVSRHPFGLAFVLALEGIAGSDIFWNEDKGDFVKKKDDDRYIVFTVIYGQDLLNLGEFDDKKFGELCQKRRGGCQVLGIVEGYEAARNLGISYCKAQTYQSNGKTYNFEYYDMHGYCADGYIVGSLEPRRAVKIAKYVDFVPITLDEFIEESTPEAAQKPDEWVKASEVKPTDESKFDVLPGSVAQSDPYTDPKDKKVKQTRWDFDPNGRVRETEILRPDLTPDSPEAPELKPPVEETPKDKDKEKDKDKDKESASEPKAASAPADLCEKNPDILACDKQPEKPEEDEFPEIPTEEVNLKFQPDSVFPNAGQCPAPVAFQAMGGTYEISTQPACEIAIKMRPFIIALAYLAAAFFVIRTIKSETA